MQHQHFLWPFASQLKQLQPEMTQICSMWTKCTDTSGHMVQIDFSFAYVDTHHLQSDSQVNLKLRDTSRLRFILWLHLQYRTGNLHSCLVITTYDWVKCLANDHGTDLYSSSRSAPPQTPFTTVKYNEVFSIADWRWQKGDKFIAVIFKFPCLHAEWKTFHYTHVSFFFTSCRCLLYYFIQMNRNTAVNLFYMRYFTLSVQLYKSL